MNLFKPAITSIILLLTNTCICQNFKINFDFKNFAEKQIVDSLLLKKKYMNTKMIFDDINSLKQNLQTLGYLNVLIVEKNRKTDSIFNFDIDLKSQVKSVHLYIGNKNAVLKSILGDTDIMKIRFSEISNFLQQLASKIENLGFSQSKVALKNLEIKKNILHADLSIIYGTKRNLNDIKIVGYDKFPKGMKKFILRTYQNKTFSTENLKKLSKDFNNIGFISETKYPEILFTTDTTVAYVYLQKINTNIFDGLIGFANDNNGKLLLNGYLDLLLVNTVNNGETFSLKWKNNGNKQTTFDIGLEVPYVFKTKFVLKANLNIFKQDTLFQNTKTILDLGYLLNYNTKILVGMQNSESTTIQSNKLDFPNLQSQFTTFQFNYFKPSERNDVYYLLFPEKSRLHIKTGFGNRNTINQSTKQQFYSANMLYNINFTEKLSLNLRSQTYYLKSNNYFANELFQFGGISSIRGFVENSLQANLAATLLSELRFAVSSNLYVYTVADYAYFEDDISKIKSSLTSFGAGFGLLTKGGLFQLIYANGNAINKKNEFGNSIVHISFKVDF